MSEPLTWCERLKHRAGSPLHWLDLTLQAALLVVAVYWGVRSARRQLLIQAILASVFAVAIFTWLAIEFRHYLVAREFKKQLTNETEPRGPGIMGHADE